MQPLDVAFFAPLKKCWRSILTEYKSKCPSSLQTGIRKAEFPSLLSKLWGALHENNAANQNLKSAFRTTGLVPLDRQKVLEKLPSLQTDVTQESQSQTNLNDSVLEYLQKIRNPECAKTGRKKKKLAVPPGKSVTSADLSLEAQPGSSGTSQPKKLKKQTIKRKKKNISNDSESEEVDEPEQKKDFLSKERDDSDSDSQPEVLFQESDEETLDMLAARFEQEEEEENEEIRAAKVGAWVLVTFSTKKSVMHYVGQILELNQENDDYLVKFVHKCKGDNSFVWPEKEDLSVVPRNDIIIVLPEPQIDRRGKVHFKLRFDGYNVQ